MDGLSECKPDPRHRPRAPTLTFPAGHQPSAIGHRQGTFLSPQPLRVLPPTLCPLVGPVPCPAASPPASESQLQPLGQARWILTRGCCVRAPLSAGLNSAVSPWKGSSWCPRNRQGIELSPHSHVGLGGALGPGVGWSDASSPPRSPTLPEGSLHSRLSHCSVPQSYRTHCRSLLDPRPTRSRWPHSSLPRRQLREAWPSLCPSPPVCLSRHSAAPQKAHRSSASHAPEPARPAPCLPLPHLAVHPKDHIRDPRVFSNLTQAPHPPLGLSGAHTDRTGAGLAMEPAHRHSHGEGPRSGGRVSAGQQGRLLKPGREASCMGLSAAAQGPQVAGEGREEA